MPKSNGLNLRQIYKQLEEMAENISVLKEEIEDIKQSYSKEPPYEMLPDSKAVFWDG